jgi:GNAT superfamily N-acetyltransferase
VVREAVAEDAALIAEITRAAWTGKVDPASGGHSETAEVVRQHLQMGGAFLMLLGEEVIGSVRWLPLESEPTVWEIMRMGVVPHHRGEYLSQHLLEAVIHHALAFGVSELRLAIRGDRARLQDLYSAYGFELAPALESTHEDRFGAAPRLMRRILGY